MLVMAAMARLKYFDSSESARDATTTGAVVPASHPATCALASSVMVL